MKKLPDQQTIRSLFDYKDGKLYWKNFQSPRATQGSLAGAKMPHGYWRIGINKVQYQLHRVVWVYHYGDIPSGLCIDHINRDQSDNRIENLRLCTYTQNEYNKPSKGYSFESGKWRVRMKICGKQRHLGMFDTKELAEEFYDLAATMVHGQYKIGATA